MATHTTTQRARLIKLIHVAISQLCMDDATYRTMLLTHTGARSTSELDLASLERVLAVCKRAGFKVRKKTQGSKSGSVLSRPIDTSNEARKVRALWLLLNALGVVRNPSEGSLAAYAKRIIGVDDLHFATMPQMVRLIETLKKWALRYLPMINKKLSIQALTEDFYCTLSQSHQEAAQRALALQNLPSFNDQWEAWSLWQQILGNDNFSNLYKEVIAIEKMGT